jgi:hypothetical protein
MCEFEFKYKMIFEFKFKSCVKELIEILSFMIYSFPRVLIPRERLLRKLAFHAGLDLVSVEVSLGDTTPRERMFPYRFWQNRRGREPFPSIFSLGGFPYQKP